MLCLCKKFAQYVYVYDFFSVVSHDIAEKLPFVQSPENPPFVMNTGSLSEGMYFI